MTVYQRNDIPEALEKIKAGKVSAVYLVFGDRYLCQEVSVALIASLLPDEQLRNRNLNTIDGDHEDISKTLNLLRTFSLFPGRQVYRVVDSRLFYSKNVSQKLWDKAKTAFAAQKTRQAARYLGGIFSVAGLSVADWRDQEISDLEGAAWQGLFGFPKPEEGAAWVEELLEGAGNDIESSIEDQGHADVAEQFVNAIEAGLPENNTLILQAETVDKRKKLYKYLIKKATVFDLTVGGGPAMAARKDQEEVIRGLINKTLAEFNKKIDSRVFSVLMERVGFHPVAAVMETEKLALSVGEAPVITLEDVDAMVGRTREDALYELNESIGKHDLVAALRIVGRLREDGLHPLAIISGMRNFIRKLLLVRSILEQQEPVYKKGMPYGAFQKGYLAGLKESRGELPVLLKVHPYALYNLFMQAEKLQLASLKQSLADILVAEYHLKMSAIPDGLILENCIFCIFKKL